MTRAIVPAACHVVIEAMPAGRPPPVREGDGERRAACDHGWMERRDEAAEIAAAWTDAVHALGGARAVAADAAADLLARYGEPHRRYHGRRHVASVLRDAAALAAELRLPAGERSLLTVAAGAHDVVYDGRPGEDERRSATWARAWLRRAGVDAGRAARVEELVLATRDHRAPAGDLTAAVLLDADLAVLGADPPTYEWYRTAVRAEYAAVDEAAWRAGRARVLSDLLDRGRLFVSAPAARRWEARARANVARELAALR